MSDGKPSLSQSIDLVLQSSKGSDRSPNSIKATAQDLAALTIFIEAHLGRGAADILVEELSPEVMITAFGDWATSRPATSGEIKKSRSHAPRSYSTATKARMRSTWAKFFDLLVDLEYLPKSPMRAVERVKVPRSSPKPFEHWEDDTIPILLDYINSPAWEKSSRVAWSSRDYALVLTLLLTGLRKSELLSLTVGSINGPEKNKVVRVIGKGAKPRTIAVAEQLVEVVNDYLIDRKERYPAWSPDDRNALFVSVPTPATTNEERSEGGRAITDGQISYLLEHLLGGAGLRSRKPQGALAHAFRHTFGTQMASAGVRMPDLAEIMGHASFQTTQIYTASSDRAQREAIESNPILKSPRSRSNSGE